MHINPDSVSTKDIYRILISTITPRPIAWVSTVDSQGRVNLAPFSFFNVVSVNPAILGFSPLLNADGQTKDTLNNIRETEGFVINIVSHSLAEKMNQTSAPYASDVDEMTAAQLTSSTSSVVAAPSVKDALVHYECSLHDIICFGEQPLAGNLVLGDIRHIHLNDSVYDNNRINVAKLDTIARMEGGFYSTTRDRFSIERPVSDKSVIK